MDVKLDPMPVCPLKVGADIRNISGATLSSMHVTEGVKRILDAYGHLR